MMMMMISRRRRRKCLVFSSAPAKKKKKKTSRAVLFLLALRALGADVNKALTDDGATPMYVADQGGHVPAIEALVRRYRSPKLPE